MTYKSICLRLFPEDLPMCSVSPGLHHEFTIISVFLLSLFFLDLVSDSVWDLLQYKERWRWARQFCLEAADKMNVSAPEPTVPTSIPRIR